MPLTTYTSGEVLTAASLNANFSFAAGGNPVAIFNDTQASGVDGGTATSGAWRTRVLNTTIVNTITSCTLTSNVISLPAGTYLVQASAPAFGCDQHQMRIANTTDSIYYYGGSSFDADLTTQSDSTIMTYFTIAGTKNIEVQHQVAGTRASTGFGKAQSFGNNNTYAQIMITKVA